MKTRGSNNEAISQTKDESPRDKFASTPLESDGLSREHLSYLRLLYVLVGSVFVAELVAMGIIYVLPALSYYIVSIIDAGIMTVLIFPVLYFLSFQPLVRHIYERQRAEQALQKKEELEEKFFNSIDLLIAYMDRDFNFIRVNDAYARVEGQTPADFIGKNHFKLYPHLENERIFRQVIESGEAFSVHEKPFEYLENVNGGVTYWDWSLQPVKSPSGVVEGLVLSLLNITERKRAQEQVREMALFPTLNPDAVLRVDASGWVNMANPAAERIGLYVGAQLTDIIPSLRELNIASCIANGTTQQVQETDLGERVLHWTMHGAPELGLAFLYSTDITLRKHAEDAIRQLSRIVEQTEDTVVVTDCNGVIEYVNPSFERLTGFMKEEALGKKPNILKSGIHDSDFFRNLWDTVLRGDVFQSEIANCKKNGELFYEAKTITPLRDAQGDITHFVATGKDITERRQAEETLRRANDDLEIRVQSRTVELRIANSELEDEIKVRRQAEEALKQSEQRLKRAQEIAHLGSWELDRVNNQLTWSDEVYRIFGLQPQEFDATYEAFLDAVHPDDRGAVDEAYAGSIREGTDSYEIEHRIVRRSNGEVRVVHEKCEHYRNKAGQIIRSVGMVHDITERKQAEDALRTSEEKFRRAFADAAIAFAMTAPDGRFLDANPAYCLLTGCTLADLQEIGFQSLIHPDDRVANMKLIDQMLAGEITDFVLENRYLRKDDKTVWVRKSISLVRSADGSPQWIIALVEDINERKQAEEALRLAHEKLEVRVRERTQELAVANRELSNEINERMEIERQLRIQTAAMQAAANGIMITDPRGQILWTNPAVTLISGYEDRDLVGQSPHIFSSGTHDAEFYKEMWKTILSGQVWRGETTNRRKDGVVYVEEQTITPVQNDNGELSHFIAIKQDITERKLIYAQLEGSNRDLQTLTAAERQQRFLAEGLVESSVVLNMSLELHAVLDHIFEQTRRTIPYRMADIVLIEGDVANVVRQWGEDTPEAKTFSENDNLALSQFPIWEQICAAKSAFLIADTDLESRWNSYFGMTWIRSYLGAPLIYNDQVIGIINLSSDQADAFHEAMAKSLRAFAAPAAVAIQNARLYEDEKQNRKVAEILSAASVALSQTLDIEMVMETILDYMQFIMPLDVAFVLLSEGDERYRVRAVRAEGDDSMQYDALRERMIDTLSEPVIGPYFAKNESMFIPDARQIATWAPPLELMSMNCWLGIPLASVGKALGIVVIAHATPYSFTKDQIGLAEAVIKQAVVAMQNAWLFEQVRSGRERLQQLSRHLVEIQENERKYIARELHDETSQSLTSLKLGLQVIEQKAAGHPQLMEQVINLKRLADETLESLHYLAVNLRPASLDHLGLVDALTGLIESTRQRTGMTAHFKTMGPVQHAALTEEIESSIYRIVQESLTNVLRHAHANYVDVILEWQVDKIVIIIEDDGVGIDMQKARETGHLGLIGMQERAEMLGGKLLVDSTPQAGTTLVVEIPYVNSNTDSR